VSDLLYRAGTSPHQRYDRTTIALHWLVAVGVLAQWLGAHVIDWFPKGPFRVDARSIHIVVGVLLVVALAYRVLWRTTNGTRFPILKPTLPDRLRSLVHLALYGLLGAVLILGLFNAWIRGDDIFGLFHLPKYGRFTPDARHALAEQVVGAHRFAANALLILAGGHVAAALYHFAVLRDRVFQRMLTLQFSSRRGHRR
jgi:cytochrome b561